MLQMRLHDALTPVHHTSVLLGSAYDGGTPHYGPRQGRAEPVPGPHPREPFRCGHAVQLDTPHEECPREKEGLQMRSV